MRFTLAILAALAMTPAARADDGLTLLVHAPSHPEAHPPLIVLLHGAGADERDMITMWPQLPDQFVVISPRAPFPDRGGGYRWYRDPAHRAADMAISRDIIDHVVDEMVKRFDADPNRVFLAGFSQGAVMTYATVLHDPAGRFRGAGVLSGSLFSGGEPKMDRSHEAFFIGHGTADPRIPFAATTKAKAALDRLGVPVAFHAYPGMGHTTGDQEIHDFAAWLAACIANPSDKAANP